jgi:hypothetical protein
MAGGTTCGDVLLRFDEPGGRRHIVLDDDGRVAYAYLFEGEKCVSDVWLYNVAQTPDIANWRDKSQLPFLNPRQYCRQEPTPRLTEGSSVVCRWFETGVDLELDGVPMARLQRGAKPGWSRFAACPGPLAKPLDWS